MKGNDLLKKRLNSVHREKLISLAALPLHSVIHINSVDNIGGVVFYKNIDGIILFIYNPKTKNLSLAESCVDSVSCLVPVDQKQFRDIFKHWFTLRYGYDIRKIEIVVYRPQIVNY